MSNEEDEDVHRFSVNELDYDRVHGVAALEQTLPLCAALKRLDLHLAPRTLPDGFGHTWFEALLPQQLVNAVCSCSHLTVLALHGDLGDPWVIRAEWLCAALRELPALEHWECNGIRLRDYEYASHKSKRGKVVRALWRVTTLRSVCFRNTALPFSSADLVKLPHLRDITCSSVGVRWACDESDMGFADSDDDWDFEPEGDAAAHAPPALETLSLRECDLPEMSLLPSFQRLRSLELDLGVDDDADCSALARALPVLPALTSLVLAGDTWQDPGDESAASGECVLAALPRCAALQTLALENRLITPTWVAELGAALPACAQLTSLRFEALGLVKDGDVDEDGDVDFQLKPVFAALPACCKLARLAVINCDLGQAGADMLCEHVAGHASLSRLQFRDESGQAVFDSVVARLPNIIVEK